MDCTFTVTVAIRVLRFVRARSKLQTSPSIAAPLVCSVQVQMAAVSFDALTSLDLARFDNSTQFTADGYRTVLQDNMLRAIVFAAVCIAIVFGRCNNPDGTDSKLFIKECGSELRLELLIHA